LAEWILSVGKAAALLLLTLLIPAAVQAKTITQIIDPNGDGAGNPFIRSGRIAVDGSRDVYVTGWSSNNAFKIDANGAITEIIDSAGDGAGNPLEWPRGIAVDHWGNVYLFDRIRL
jgi:hypothetical protein